MVKLFLCSLRLVSNKSFIMRHISKSKIYRRPIIKRARILSPSEKFLEKYFPLAIGRARKHFLKTEGEASVENTTGTDHIIYFEPFLKYDLLIEKIPSKDDFFTISIKPVDWAEAFLQLNIHSTTEFLQKAIVTQECLKIIKDDPQARESIAQIILIAGNWMMSKFQAGSHIDPYSFPTDFQKILRLSHPSPQESTVIQAALIANFTKIEEMLVAEVDREIDTIVDLSMTPTRFWNWDEWDMDFPLDKDYDTLMEIGAPLADELEASRQEDIMYEDIYNQFVSHLRKGGCSMNTAQIVCALTRSTIPNNRDQFVDGVQFSDDRWRRAMRQTTIAKIAAKLSSTIIRLNFDDKPFKRIGDLPANYRLAIYRGAKFIQQLSGAATDESSFVEQFDSAIKQHNFYPTEEECAQIDPEIVSNAASVLKGLKNAPNKIGMHSSSRPSQLSSVPAKKEMQPFAVKSEPEVIPSDEMDTQSDNDTDTVLTPKIGTISIGAKACHRHQTAYQEAAGCMEQENPGQLCDASIIVSRQNAVKIQGQEEVNPREIPDQDFKNLNIAEIPFLQFQSIRLNGGTQPILKSANCTEPDVVIISISDKSKNVTRSHAFSKATWIAVVDMYETSGAIVVGKQLLLCSLFEENELKTQTPCGRKSPKYGKLGKLDMNRQQQLLDTIRFLIGMVPLQNSELSVGHWSDNLESVIKTKVLSEGSNEIRKRLNEK